MTAPLRAMTTFGAIILAAGESSRMGMPKALLLWRGRSFLENIADVLRRSGVNFIRVVASVGMEKAIRDHLSSPGIELVVNPDPGRGQLSSLQCGLQDFPADVALVCLVDHPKISTSLIVELKEACLGTDALAVIPRHQNRRGHPIALNRELIQAMLAAPETSTPKQILLQYWPRVLEMETADPGIVADVDTPEDYERFLETKFPER